MSSDRPTGILAHAHAGNRLAGAFVAAVLASSLVLLALADRYFESITLFGPGSLRVAVLAWLGCIVAGWLFPRLPARVVGAIDFLA